MFDGTCVCLDIVFKLRNIMHKPCISALTENIFQLMMNNNENSIDILHSHSFSLLTGLRFSQFHIFGLLPKRSHA